MSGRGRTRLAPAALVLALALGLAACADDSGDETPATGTPSASESSPESHSESHSESPSESPSESSSGTGSDGDTVALTVTREGDSFTPNGERVELAVGQTLVLTVSADEAGELHVHSTPEQEVAYAEGTSEHEIVIDRPGVVEVESHEPDVIVLQLEVR